MIPLSLSLHQSRNIECFLKHGLNPFLSSNTAKAFFSSNNESAISPHNVATPECTYIKTTIVYNPHIVNPGYVSVCEVVN
jgi:hypothetical protein